MYNFYDLNSINKPITGNALSGLTGSSNPPAASNQLQKLLSGSGETQTTTQGDSLNKTAEGTPQAPRQYSDAEVQMIMAMGEKGMLHPSLQSSNPFNSPEQLQKLLSGSTNANTNADGTRQFSMAEVQMIMAMGEKGMLHPSLQSGDSSDMSPELMLMSMLMGSGNQNDFFSNMLMNAALSDAIRNQTGGDTKFSDEYNQGKGNKLAKIGNAVANSKNTVGRCYAGVAEALKKAGFNETSNLLSGESAYMATKGLDKSSEFKKVKVSDLKSLPAGAIIVSEASNGHPHGHIAITDGKGGEYSDHYEANIIQRPKQHVYIPV